MSIQATYNHWSATYDTDENLTRDLYCTVTRDTLSDLRCGAIVEIGCGTGKNTELLARIGERVHAIDFAEEMINRARKKIGMENVSFSTADITAPWPSGDGSADLVVCNLVLEHIEDLPFVFAEAFRVLISGGRFFISELHPYRQYRGTKARFRSGRGITELPAFVHHVSDFLEAAEKEGFTLKECREWWHEEDRDTPPRLVSFIFEK